MKTTAVRSCAGPTAGFGTTPAASLAPVSALTQTLIIAICLSWHCQAAAQLYRWIDEQGNVHYTGKIPPSQSQRGHTELSDNGIRVRSVPPAKTAEELERERELERLQILDGIRAALHSSATQAAR